MTTTMSTRITLRALDGDPLEVEHVHDMVVATAKAIAERHGIDVLSVNSSTNHITVHLRTGRIESLGFAAELRRLTNSWYEEKYGIESLWGDAPQDDDDPAEAWKRA
ncbi:MAG: hypothetical protein AAF432_00695 [Planctomycetota bacterium]